MGPSFTHRFISIAFAASALLTLPSVQPQVQAQATLTTERVLMSAPFGLAPDQGVLLTLFVREGAPAVGGHVKIFDSSGNPVAESREVTISGGTFHSFHFEPPDIHLAEEEGTGRRQVRTSCWIRVGSPWARIDDVTATVEIISSGVTDGSSNTFLNGEHPPTSTGSPTATLSDFLIGMVPGQSLRVNIFNPGEPNLSQRPTPIRVSVRGWNASGKVVAVSEEQEVLPEHFASLNFDYRDLDMEAEPRTDRKQVRFKPLFAFTVLDPVPGNLPDVVVVHVISFETVDNRTGKTVVLAGTHTLVRFVAGLPSK